jgi:multidrug efflux system outer membrane protein
MKTHHFLSLLASALLLSGCLSLAPDYQRPEAPVPAELPEEQAVASADEAAPHPAELPWEEFFTDPNLRQVVRLALDNNRDLRIAALTMERARAMYGVQRAEIFPAINASATGAEQRSSADMTIPGYDRNRGNYEANLGITAWEIDLFGRIRSLEAQALQSFLATEQARRGAQVALVAEIGAAYLTLAADRENLDLAQSTQDSQMAAYDLVRLQYDNMLANEIDLYRAKSQVDVARLDVARFTQRVEQDLNALNLLAGTAVPDQLLPKDLGSVQVPHPIAAGLSSEVLFLRPDIMAAENQLQGAYAFVGAARAAFFPRISLTSIVGTASTELSGLFQSDTDTWTFAPQIRMPIFDPRTMAAYKVSKADQDLALGRYEKAIQTAFREVADTLAVRRNIDAQLEAQTALAESARSIHALAQKRYEKGIDSYLSVLDAQRSLYGAQQATITLQRAKLANQIQLYAVLGGGGDPSTGEPAESVPETQPEIETETVAFHTESTVE